MHQSHPNEKLWQPATEDETPFLATGTWPAMKPCSKVPESSEVSPVHENDIDAPAFPTLFSAYIIARKLENLHIKQQTTTICAI